MLHDNSLKFEKKCAIEGVLLDATEAVVELGALKKNLEKVSNQRKNEEAINDGTNVATVQSVATVKSADPRMVIASEYVVPSISLVPAESKLQKDKGEKQSGEPDKLIARDTKKKKQVEDLVETGYTHEEALKAA
ncbi:hypothetical protein L7F22_044330 [Adiantum nelumboides]|nr:hypothetical protein [Adiantum nelumboides]